MTNSGRTLPQGNGIEEARKVVPGIPCGAEGPVFKEPWEAQAFAIAVALQARGVFTWGEWASLIGEEIRKAQAAGDPDTGATYYSHWLATLERIVAMKGVANVDVLARTKAAWDHAAQRTPHGAAIELTPEDYD